MLKRHNRHTSDFVETQPPLGGCVLKLQTLLTDLKLECQPPLGGCVLKPYNNGEFNKRGNQPPLGGCVLKLHRHYRTENQAFPAAFRRLCVETRA